MPILETGSMDEVKTGFEPIPAQKKVRVQIQAPSEAQKPFEVKKSEDGTLTMLNIWGKILEGPSAGRVCTFGFVPVAVTRETYLGWKLQDNGVLLSESEKSKMWEEKAYLRELKRIAQAVGLDTTQPISTEDMYGRELIVDVIQKVNKEDESKIENEFKNPKKV